MQEKGMMYKKRSTCGIKLLRNWAALCVVLLVVFLLCRDPFLILWWPQRPTEETSPTLPLDMATDSIDDMYNGCRSETASIIDLFGVFEWHANSNFSVAWSLVERRAKKPIHKPLKDDHAISVYLFTRYKSIRQNFNKALKMGKHKYSTHLFRYHYFYFYLTDVIQVLNNNQMTCRTVYHRTWKNFERNLVNSNMRFGVFTWAVSNKQMFEFSGNVSCFEIYTCFGADITYYSSTKQKEQVLIPTYEVFKVTDVLTNDPWCEVVYKLQSTKIPRTDQNCKLYYSLTKTSYNGGNGVILSACFLLLIVSSFVLVKHSQLCYVAAVLSALLVVIIIALIFS